MTIFFNADQFFDANNFKIEETNPKLSRSDDKSFSILHLNIGSLEKNFDNLVLFIATLSFNFKVILKQGVLVSMIIAISLSYLITVAFTKQEALVKLVVV